MVNKKIVTLTGGNVPVPPGMLGSEQMRRKSQSKKFLTCHLVVVLFFKALSKNYTFP